MGRKGIARYARGIEPPKNPPDIPDSPCGDDCDCGDCEENVCVKGLRGK